MGRVDPSDKRKRVSLKHVAERAGVSSATVSQVLNGRDNWASKETRARIVSAAADLGYRPSLVAKSLRVGLSHTVGFVTTVFVSNGRSVGFDSMAAATDYMAVMTFNPNTQEMEDRQILRLLDRGVDGIAIYPCEGGEHRELRRLVERRFPVVTFDGAALLDVDCDDVSPDFQEVGRMQAAHALAIGKRRVLIVAPRPSATINDLRDEGIRRCLAENGAPPPLLCEFEQAVDRETPPGESLYGPLHAYIRAHRGDFDAVISYDSVCSLACRSLLDCGLRIPDDVAVIGAGNGLLASYGAMPITSVDTNNERSGGDAFELLRQRIESPDADWRPRRIRVEATLVARQSSIGPG